MPNNTLLKECKRPNTYTPISLIPLPSIFPLRLSLTLRTINNLIRYYKIPRLDLLLQAPHGTKRNNSPNANASQSRNIRSRRHLMGCDFVG
jgi:hypothetical protein